MNQSPGANTNNSSSDGAGSSQIVTSGRNYNLSNNSCSQVLLQTLQVRIVGPKDSARVRLLIDTGSDHSYVSKKAAEILGLNSLGIEKLRHGLIGGPVTAEKPNKIYKMQLTDLNGKNPRQYQILDEDQICASVNFYPSGPWLNQLRNYSHRCWNRGKGHSCLDWSRPCRRFLHWSYEMAEEWTSCV